jgi:hypothetical protein
MQDDKGMEEEYKFRYLIHGTIEGSRERVTVERFQANSGDYSEVIESLKHRFGKEELR